MNEVCLPVALVAVAFIQDRFQNSYGRELKSKYCGNIPDMSVITFSNDILETSFTRRRKSFLHTRLCMLVVFFILSLLLGRIIWILLFVFNVFLKNKTIDRLNFVSSADSTPSYFALSYMFQKTARTNHCHASKDDIHLQKMKLHNPGLQTPMNTAASEVKTSHVIFI